MIMNQVASISGKKYKYINEIENIFILIDFSVNMEK